MLVEFFPFLRHLPGVGKWKPKVDRIADRMGKIYTQQFRSALRLPGWNWCKGYATRPETAPMSELERAYSVGSTYEALLTPYEIVRVFLLAALALAHPNETRKMQRELDYVVGTQCLPNFDDEPSPICPSVNQWAMFHEDHVSEDPYVFRPQRWADNAILPRVLYGSGFRGCPGKACRSDHLSIHTARLFWAYTIEHAVRDGKRAEVDFADLMNPRGGGSFFNQVAPFEAAFRVRGSSRQPVLEAEWDAVERDVTKILNQVK
nr:cytochrome P450 [Aspergillus sp.]